jgi:hypothetical protein
MIGSKRFAARFGPGLRSRTAEELANRFDLRGNLGLAQAEKEALVEYLKSL